MPGERVVGWCGFLFFTNCMRGKTDMRQYLDALERIMNEGVARDGRNGRTVALFGIPMRFDLQHGFPAVTTKQLAWKNVVAELLFFISGSDNVRDLQKRGCHIWDANAEDPTWMGKARFPGDLGRTYGTQWRRWTNMERVPGHPGINHGWEPDTYENRPIDQLSRVIEEIKREPQSRRHIVTAWNPAEADNTALPPCHVLFQFFAAETKLSLAMYQRSADMFLGVPFNIASYALLLEMVAQVVRKRAHELVIFLADAHIYNEHFDAVHEQFTRDPLPLPRLRLNRTIESIDDFGIEDIRLLDYHPHPPIKARMIV